MLSCKCNGMNEECMICGGSGFINDSKIEIIQCLQNQKELEKQSEELQKYINGNSEKMYDSDLTNKIRKRKRKQQVITIAELDSSETMKYVGPNNPNRTSKSHQKKSKKKRRK